MLSFKYQTGNHGQPKDLRNKRTESNSVKVRESQDQGCNMDCVVIVHSQFLVPVSVPIVLQHIK